MDGLLDLIPVAINTVVIPLAAKLIKDNRKVKKKLSKIPALFEKSTGIMDKMLIVIKVYENALSKESNGGKLITQKESEEISQAIALFKQQIKCIEK